MHRFGSSLNLHTHFHVVVLDGAYVRRGPGVAFFASPAPPREALEAMVKRVVRRTMKWLKRKGYVREDLDAHASNESKPLSPIEQLAMLAMQRGTFETRRDSEDDDSGDDDSNADARAPNKQGNVVAHLGFNLHAGVTIAAHDDLGRERLLRYGARPPFSLARLRVLKDGNVSYLVKKIGRGRAKHRVMTPVEFLARLSALIFPPRFSNSSREPPPSLLRAWRRRPSPSSGRPRLRPRSLPTALPRRATRSRSWPPTCCRWRTGRDLATANSTPRSPGSIGPGSYAEPSTLT